MDKESKLLQMRKDKINELKDLGINLYPNDFKPSCSIVSLKKLLKKTRNLWGGRRTILYCRPDDGRK